MEFKIITDIENPLFNRREIQGEIKTDVNPSNEKVLELISKETKNPKENIKIRTIQGKFGSKVFLIVANVYASLEDKNKVEKMSKKEKEAEEKLKQAEEKSESNTEIEKIPEQQEPLKEESSEVNKEKAKDDEVNQKKDESKNEVKKEEKAEEEKDVKEEKAEDKE